jgi:hypothetical protein
MQRSAAKSTASSPSTPNGPSSKKVRLSSGASAPGTPGTPDHEILQSALAAEEKKRQEALDKAAQHSGETKWVLSFKDPLDGKRGESLKVRQAGFAELDAEDTSEEDEEEARPIRKQFGGGVKRAEVRNRAGLSNGILTPYRTLWCSKRRMSPTARLSHPLKTTIAMTPQQPSYARRSAKSPQSAAHHAMRRPRESTNLQGDLRESPMEI